MSQVFMNRHAHSGPETSNCKSLCGSERHIRAASNAFGHLLITIVSILAIALVSFMGFGAIGSAMAAQKLPDGTQLAASFVRPNDMNSGALLLPAIREGQYIEAPRLKTEVEIEVNGPVARVSVTQRFENPADGWVEGIYVFPLPEQSAVDTLKMRVGDRLIEGVIKVREEARRVYEEAKRQGKKAALLEQQRDNLFTNNVANIGPGETVIVNIEYQQTIRQDNGLFSLRFPMVVAPRYSPQPIIQTVDFERGGSGFGTVDPVPDRDQIEAPVLDPRENAKINPVSLSVKLAAGFPIGEVESPFHELVSRNIDEATRTLTLKNDSVPADRDFVLNWRSSGKAPNAALFRQTVDGETYVLAFVTPPEIDVRDLPRKNREVIFVIDNSGSMAGESMSQAKLALEDALSRLSSLDRFNIIRFDDTHEKLFADAVPADRENLAVALQYVRVLEADGGTEMLPALQTALVDNDRNDSDRVRQVVFITDGAIGNEQQLFDAIATGKGRSRVFTIGIGSAPNSFFMTRAAEIGRGTFTHIGDIGQVKEEMGRFFEKLENPVMTGLAVQGEGVNLSEVSPNPLPDLYKGEPIVIAAIAGMPNGTLQITGDYAGQPWQVNMDLARAAEGSGIGKLWARRRIASLEASRSYGADIEAINREVETVALAHHLVSSRTSLVAIDVKVTRPEGEAVSSTKLSLNLPAGWDADKWFEEAAPAPAPMQKAGNQQARFALLAAAPSKAAAADIAQAHRQSVQLPQTATSAERNMILGLLFVLLATGWLAVARTWGRFARRVDQQERSNRVSRWQLHLDDQS